MVKVNAVERLRAELRSPRWGGDHIAMGTNTDPYQHAEGKYHLTRGIVETLVGGAQPVQHPDQVDARAARRRRCWPRRRSGPTSSVSFSIGTLDRSVWKLTEPGTPPPDRRVEALRRLTDLGLSLRGAGGAGVAGALGLRGPADRGGRGLRGGRRRVDQRGGAAPAGQPCGGTTSTGWARPGRTWCACTGGASGAGRTRRTTSGERVEGIVRAAARRCGVTGRDRYRGRVAGTRWAARQSAADARRRRRTRSSGRGGQTAAAAVGRRPAGRAVGAGRAPYDLGFMRGAGASLRRAGRRALIGLATLLAAGALDRRVLRPAGRAARRARAARPMLRRRPLPTNARPTPSSTPRAAS